MFDRINVKRTHQFLLHLLRNSITGKSSPSTNEIFSKAEWEKILKFAILQGVASVLMDEIKKMPPNAFPPKEILLKWFAHTIGREASYKQQWNLSCEFADALAERDVKCLVLKGFALASYYPLPETRVFGDFDCYLIDSDNKEMKFEVGNEVARQMGLKVMEAGYKHTHIYYKNLLIENHQFLTNFNETNQGVRIEKILRYLALNGKKRKLANTNLYMPSPEFMVVFLLKHTLGDFIANDMTLKSLYDWAEFLKAEQEHIDWKKMNMLLVECRLKPFFDLMTEICMTYLGLDIYANGLSVISRSKIMDDMLKDILYKPIIGCGQLSFWQKIPNIVKRFMRQYKYHSLETENYWRLVWNTLSYSSFIKRKVRLD